MVTTSVVLLWSFFGFRESDTVTRKCWLLVSPFPSLGRFRHLRASLITSAFAQISIIAQEINFL